MRSLYFHPKRTKASAKKQKKGAGGGGGRRPTWFRGGTNPIGKKVRELLATDRGWTKESLVKG